MADIKSEVEAHVASAKRFGADLPVRVKLSTEEAIAFVKALETAAVQNAEHVFAHAKSFEALVAAELPKERKALTDRLNATERVEHAFWEAFHGQSHADAEIVRRVS